MYVITFVYLIILVAFTTFVPIIAGLSFIKVWKVVLMPALYIVSILSSVIVVYIFKAPQDDGSELIICSKPLDRKKMIWSKFFVSGLMFLFFSIITAIFCLFAMIPNGVSKSGVAFLMLSCFVGNIVNFIFFGSIATFFSIFWNKIVVIIANIIVVVLMVIYYTVQLAISESPASKLTKNNVNTVHTSWYVDKSNKAHGSAYILPTSLLSSFDISSLDSLSLEHEKELWDQALKESPANALYAFNFFLQLEQAYLVGPLAEANDWNLASSNLSFGQHNGLNYTINDLVHQNTGQDTDLTDDDTSWMSITNDLEPYFYISVASLTRNDTVNFATYNSSGISYLNELLELLINFESNITVNYVSNDSSLCYKGNTNYLYNPTGTKENNYVVAAYYNGVVVSKNLQYYTNDQLKPNTDEKDLFNYLLYEILFDTNSNLYKNTFSSSYPGEYWTFYLASDPNYESVSYLYRLIYDEVEQLKQDNIIPSDEYNTIADFGQLYMKFRYFIYEQLIGANTLNDYSMVNTNYKDSSGNTISVIPWSQYFTFCYNTLFNSFNTRNYSSINPDTSYINFKQLLGNGFLPLPSYSTSTSVNIINTLAYLGIEQEEGINKFLPIYDGSSSPSDEYKELFEVYKNTNVSSEYSEKVEGEYGYCSEIGLKSSSLLTYFFNSSPSAIYYYVEYYNRYTAEFNTSSNSILLYENTIFSFEQSSKLNWWQASIIYVAIGMFIDVIAYYKYVKYDFK